ncbi:MAG: hypothetical protein HRU50_00065 [Winogradskyella sp.]|uniref:hypothetical protein n=1 Tax=Winogradskyella sp. TaxID=1883156 RepID=UPI0025EE119E|nr:hypothetical protein [Winogradskyella sp.]NRB58315.1 hypothetical protein [Winogradskyella sp.]
MGSVIKATCGCGYEKDITVGGGRLNFKTTQYFPHYCKTCQEVVSGNLLKEEKLCASCETKDKIPYNNKDLILKKGNGIVFKSFENIITDGLYKCPCTKCDNLKFSDTGIIWD